MSAPSLLLLPIAAALGWFVGGAANIVADVLPLTPAERPKLSMAAWPHFWTLWWRWSWPTCPHCGLVRPRRVTAFEIVMALAFVVSAFLFRSDPVQLVVVWLYTAFLLTVLVIDIEHRRVLNVMLAPATIAICVLSFLPGMPGIRSALAGGAAGLGLFVVFYIIGRGRLGAGDVKLAAVIGLMTGYPAVWTALLGGVILGALAAVLLLLTRRANLKTSVAYAPYLAVGALLTIWTALPPP